MATEPRRNPAGWPTDTATEADGGPDAVLAMMRAASRRTGGTFRIRPREIVANGEHAVALVDWSAERDGGTLEGKEVAVYRVRGGKVVEVHFHQDDGELDRQFWG